MSKIQRTRNNYLVYYYILYKYTQAAERRKYTRKFVRARFFFFCLPIKTTWIHLYCFVLYFRIRFQIVISGSFYFNVRRLCIDKTGSVAGRRATTPHPPSRSLVIFKKKQINIFSVSSVHIYDTLWRACGLFSYFIYSA